MNWHQTPKFSRKRQTHHIYHASRCTTRIAIHQWFKYRKSIHPPQFTVEALILNDKVFNWSRFHRLPIFSSKKSQCVFLCGLHWTDRHALANAIESIGFGKMSILSGSSKSHRGVMWRRCLHWIIIYLHIGNDGAGQQFYRQQFVHRRSVRSCSKYLFNAICSNIIYTAISDVRRKKCDILKTLDALAW